MRFEYSPSLSQSLGSKRRALEITAISWATVFCFRVCIRWQRKLIQGGSLVSLANIFTILEDSRSGDNRGWPGECGWSHDGVMGPSP
jgi:hypothetical protein